MVNIREIKNTKKSIKILVVEDNKSHQEDYGHYLSGLGFTIIPALTINMARNLFYQHPDIMVIIMDACVPGDDINTEPLVREFRQTFKGPIIAGSSSEYYNSLLIAAGCDYDSGGTDNTRRNKMHVIRQVKKIISSSGLPLVRPSPPVQNGNNDISL